PIFVEQAFMWTMNDNGEFTQQNLGGFEQTFAPPEDPEEEQREPQPLLSFAADVNNHGVAVGGARRIVTFANGAQNISVLSSVVYR
ncbi:hypothetical protein, partial [Klebsiella pneumoniae]|uniref:hypothetical protein n=1 Tax=Klebsiella pneumoniae TaxID=573 RepID=UPI003639FB3F